MKERKSQINETYIIREDKWVISLARKDNVISGIWTQHAFLVLEGIENGKPTIYFMDFVGEHWELSLPNSEIGRVRFVEINGEEVDNCNPSKNNLIFQCKSKMMNIITSDKIASKQWFINKDDALRLIHNVKSEKNFEKKYPFSILGKQSVLTGSSAESSNKVRGHNCFTWAKEKLKAADIEVKGSDTVEWINNYACITGFTVNSPSWISSYSIFNTKCATATAVIIGATAMCVALNYSKKI